MGTWCVGPAAPAAARSMQAVSYLVSEPYKPPSQGKSPDESYVGSYWALGISKVESNSWSVNKLTSHEGPKRCVRRSRPNHETNGNIDPCDRRLGPGVLVAPKHQLLVDEREGTRSEELPRPESFIRSYLIDRVLAGWTFYIGRKPSSVVLPIVNGEPCLNSLRAQHAVPVLTMQYLWIEVCMATNPNQTQREIRKFSLLLLSVS